MDLSKRTIPLLLGLTLVLASCANAPSGEAGGGGAASVPGASGGGGFPGASGEPADPIHGIRCASPSAVDLTDPDAPVSTCVDAPGGPIPDPMPQHVEPRPGMAGVAARPWETVDASADTLILTISFVSGVEPCAVLDHVVAKQTAKAVTITLYEGHDPDAGTNVACPEIGVYKSVDVQLDSPLGDRDVRDGAKA